MISTAVTALLLALQTPAVPAPAVPTPTVPTPTVPGVVPPTGFPANVPNTNRVDDRKFLREAAEEELLHLEMSKLAAAQSSDAGVKQYAQNLVDGLTKVQSQMKDLADKKSAEIPSALDGKQKEHVAKLGKLSGKRFDKAYLRGELDFAEADVKRFNAEKERGQDPDVMAFATATLPELQKHLDAVKDLKRRNQP